MGTIQLRGDQGRERIKGNAERRGASSQQRIETKVLRAAASQCKRGSVERVERGVSVGVCWCESVSGRQVIMNPTHDSAAALSVMTTDSIVNPAGTRAWTVPRPMAHISLSVILNHEWLLITEVIRDSSCVRACVRACLNCIFRKKLSLTTDCIINSKLTDSRL